MNDSLNNIYRVDNLFSAEDLQIINESIKSIYEKHQYDIELGRLKLELNSLPISIERKIEAVAESFEGKVFKTSNVTYVEYSNKYGQPNLPTHFDGDQNNLVFDYQLESSTSWDIGINTELYQLKDNSSVIFNANENIHWRPIKDFKDGEYIKMIFFRVYDVHNKPNYLHLDYAIDDQIFKEINNLRDSMAQK